MIDMIDWLREGAEIVMSEQNDLGLVLDGSLESVEAIEAYLDDLRASHAASPAVSDVSDDEYKVILALGAYLGEVIIKEAGTAQWALGPDDPHDPWEAHIESASSEYKVYPLGKVLRRYEAGADDSLLEFAKLAIGMFRGEFGFESRVLH